MQNLRSEAVRCSMDDVMELEVQLAEYVASDDHMDDAESISTGAGADKNSNNSDAAAAREAAEARKEMRFAQVTGFSSDLYHCLIALQDNE